MLGSIIGGYLSVIRSNNTSIIYYLNKDFNPTILEPIIFVKKVIHKKYRHYDFVNKEVFWLNKLKSFDRTPNVIDFNEDTILMDYMGQVITKDSVPADWEDQINYIIKMLGSLGVSHNDIKIEEILVKDGKINLIDFQHATATREEFIELRRLGKVTVEPYVKNDYTSLYSIIKEVIQ